MKKTKTDQTQNQTQPQPQSINQEDTVTETAAQPLEPQIEPSEIELLSQQYDEMQTKYLMARADYQNLEKRMDKEKDDWIKFGNLNLLTRMIHVLDNLDRAAQYVNDPGLNMVRNDFGKVFTDFQVEEIKAAGQAFDHNTMEAVDKQPGQENLVLKVLQKGYLLHGRVLKPAQVIVGNGETAAQ